MHSAREAVELLVTKDLRFAKDRSGRIDRYNQERKDLDKMPFDASIKDSFESFSTAASNYNNQEVEVVREGLYPFFGDTYYYDYYAMSQLPEY